MTGPLFIVAVWLMIVSVVVHVAIARRTPKPKKLRAPFKHEREYFEAELRAEGMPSCDARIFASTCDSLPAQLHVMHTWREEKSQCRDDGFTHLDRNAVIGIAERMRKRMRERERSS